MYIKELKKWIADQPDHAKLVVNDRSIPGYDRWEEATSHNIKIEVDTPETLRELERKVESHLERFKDFLKVVP